MTSVTIEDVEKLNKALRIAPDTVKTLLLAKVPCPKELEPMVFTTDENGAKMVSVLGLLNATIFEDGDRLARTQVGLKFGLISCKVEDDGWEQFQKFDVWQNRNKV